MSAYLVNGDYVYDGAGGVMSASDDHDALLRRCLDRLKARRGGCVLMPEFGSRLWTLGREPVKARQSAALRYAAEALEPEGVAVLAAAVNDAPDGIEVVLRVDAGGGDELLSLVV